MIYERGRTRDEIYAIEINNFDSDIMKIRDIFFKKVHHGLIFNRTPKKADFILKSAYIETLDKHLTI